jgi:hypothetical protein
MRYPAWHCNDLGLTPPPTKARVGLTASGNDFGEPSMNRPALRHEAKEIIDTKNLIGT